MTINERVKYLRKNILNMNQTDFAQKLGMKQTSISSMEKKDGTVTDRAIKTMVLLFNIHEDWIRYEKKPILLESDTLFPNDNTGQNNITNEELEIIKCYLELDPHIRETIISHFKDYFYGNTIN